MMMPAMQPEDRPSEHSESAEPTGGYELRVCVYPDGTFAVKKGPLDSPASESAEGGPPDAPGAEVIAEGLPSVEAVLKTVLATLRANPAGGDELANFTAAFGAERGKMGYGSEADDSE